LANKKGEAAKEKPQNMKGMVRSRARVGNEKVITENWEGGIHFAQELQI